MDSSCAPLRLPPPARRRRLCATSRTSVHGLGRVVLLRPTSIDGTTMTGDRHSYIDSHTCSIRLIGMQEGDLVRIGANGVCQFRVLEVDDTHARVIAMAETPGTYGFSMRVVDLFPWTD